MIADVVVLASVVLTAAFVAGWLVSPSLRAWIERPKHRFRDAVRQYDVEQCSARSVRQSYSDE
jgi:hypothetical protein